MTSAYPSTKALPGYTLAQMAALTGAQLASGTYQYLFCNEAGYEGVFAYDASSSASAVTGYVIVPSGGVGRLIRKTASKTEVDAAQATANAAVPKTGATGSIDLSGATLTVAAPGAPSSPARLQDVNFAANTNPFTGATTVSGVLYPGAVTVLAVPANTGVSALPAYTYTSGVITMTATGVVTVDGNALALNDLVGLCEALSANQPYNGPYRVTTAGAVGVACVLTRCTEADSGAELAWCSYWAVIGTDYANYTAKINVGTIATVGVTALPVILTQNMAGLAAETAAREAADMVLTGGVTTQGINPPITGSSPLPNGNTWWLNDPIPSTGIIKRIGFKNALSGVQVGTHSWVFGEFTGVASATLKSEIELPVVAGVNEFTLYDLLSLDPDFDPHVVAGWRTGPYGPTNCLPYYATASGKTQYYCVGKVGTGTSLASAGALEIEAFIEIATGDEGQQLLTETLTSLGTLTQQNGYPSIGTGVNPAPGGSTYFSGEQTVAGPIYGVVVDSQVPGPAKLAAASRAGDNASIQGAAVDVRLVYGNNYLPNFNPIVPNGWLIGVYGAGSPVTYSSDLTKTGYVCSGLVGSASLLTALNNTHIKIGWQTATGTKSAAAIAQAAGLALNQVRNAVLDAGFGLLSGADNTGATDSAAAFNNTLPVYPHVYVPPGVYNLSSLINHGWGLFGPPTALVYVNGVLLALPQAPELTDRWLAFRNSRMPQIGTGSAEIIFGDSITNGLHATSDANTWATLLCRYSNWSVSAGDECVLTNFNQSDASGTPAFHGVTAVSPSTITNGTNGPLGVSWLLAVGQKIQVTGAYSSVDVTYQGVSGGQLTFAHNGTTYKTLTCATGGSDVYSGPSATGQTASGTYTITNTGSAPVEITSLARFGILAASFPPRLVVIRVAHGGYSYADFTSLRVASAVRIATNITGGKTNHSVLVSLGTNDAAVHGYSYSQELTYVTDFGGYLITGQSIKPYHIRFAMPWRWGSNGVYMDAVNGAIYDAWNALSVTKSIGTDGFDIVTWGDSSDGGHPGDAGMRLVFQMVVESSVRSR